MRGLKYIFHRATWEKLPVLPRMYSTEFKLSDVDRDTETLMQMTHTRCPQGVEVLKKRHGAKSARTLIEQLPARRRPRRIKSRIMGVFRRAFGLLPYDPMKSIARQYMRKAR